MTDGALSSTLTSAPGVPGADVNVVPTWRRLGRRLRPGLAVAPFLLYSFLGLGLPILAVVDFAFRDPAGHLTSANVRLMAHNPYLLGFKNSIILAAITSVVPGVLGVILAYTIHTSRSGLLRRLVATASGVLANFGGINLTFMFIATIGSTGLLSVWLTYLHINLTSLGFNLYSFYGVVVVYMYFQIPLMVLVITPALAGLRASWREAASNMGASPWRYWRHVGIPVLMPSVLGGMLLLFGSAFAAYATAETLTAGTVTLAPIQIGNLLAGNAISGQVNVGYAIGLGMFVVLAITMVLYGLVRKRASKWLR